MDSPRCFLTDRGETVAGHATPASWATRAIWVRLVSPSLVRVWVMWALTVATLMASLSAICSVCEALGDGKDNLALSGAEGVERAPGLVLAAPSLEARAMSRRVMLGEKIGSPAATRRIASVIRAGGASLRRKPLAPARRVQDVLVGVEGGQHDHFGRVVAHGRDYADVGRARRTRVVAIPSTRGDS